MDTAEKSYTHHYDEKMIATKYAKCSYFHESRLLIDAFNLKKMVRCIQALSSEPIEQLLDFGCGDGFMTRMLVHDSIVKSAVGIDVSKDMIELAKHSIQQHEQEHFQYHTIKEDFESTINSIGTFPLVMSTFMMCHLATVNELQQMLARIRRLCTEFFFGLISNPYFDPKNAHTLEKYGIKYIGPTNPSDEDKYCVTFDADTENEFTLTDFWYTAATFENLFRKVGFKTFQWVPVEVDSEAKEERKAFLADACQIYIGFIATV
ncbi:unnamed protein product [Rotaria sp. Silwood2]|nr:unnamed protein product [Rotaria sp. Silwood2]CAF2931646.1 unnamed protein product [Rotaria sp. Silwood2]CAF3070768.1 unnamed protein product [Rotaria sp. Silwood2]CAF4300473.1 unnamed protein product [Rotaria sp. Silwood2]CAF4478262.1 unnamed protein product [Rotaria sp. Silwood2]